MKNTFLALISCALVALAVFSPIHVKAFGSYASSTACSKPPTIACRMTRGRCDDSRSAFNGKTENGLSSILKIMFLEEESGRDDDTRHEPSSSMQRKAPSFAVRSTLASAFASALVASSFVVSATAESLITPTPAVQKTMVAASSSTPSPLAGNIVLGAWIGISGYAGIKGAGDLYQRYRKEQEEQ